MAARVPKESVTLSDEQRAVIELPSAARAFVTAGAGCGKTHVLAHRIIELVSTQGLSPGGELLVLSFSRAAVAELRSRLRAVGSQAGYAPVMTFDSFATGLLATFDPEGTWRSLGYDARIEAAVRLLRTDQNPQEFAAPKHVLVDELQDLVGPRAELVQALLARSGSGFTLFWDPAQSIYGHAARQQASMHAQTLLTSVRGQTASGLTELSLSNNYRAQTSQARSAAEFGARLRRPTPDYHAVRRDMDTFVLGLPPVGDLQVVVPSLRRRSGMRTAVLCRTNGQALVVSRRLGDLGVAHRLQRGATERAAAAWIGQALTGVDSRRITKSKFLSRLTNARLAVEAPDPVDAWRLLKLLDPRRTEDLDLPTVAERVNTRSLPEELFLDEEAEVVVSTIHRAKGLEFDRVILAEPDPADVTTEDFEEETRILYVALTRARSELCIMRAPDTRGMSVDRTAGGRWCRREFGGGRGRVQSISVCADDVDAVQPPGTASIGGKTVAEVQAYFRTQVHAGDPVELTKIAATDTPAPVPRYAVVHDGTTIGTTSNSFTSALRRALPAQQAMPERLKGASVDCIETVAGDPSVTRSHGLGEAGLWCSVRLRGLCDIETETASGTKVER